MMRKILMGVGGVVVFIIAFYAINAAMAFMTANSVERVADNFMTELKNGNETNAYAMYSPELKNQMHPETFAAAFNSVEVQSWHFTSRSVNGDYGRVAGIVVIDGREVNTTLRFINNAGIWQITSFDLDLY